MKENLNKPIKVAMIIQDYLPRVGGAEKQLAALAPLLKVRGVETHIVTKRYAGLSRYEVFGDVPVHRIRVAKSKILSSLMFTLFTLPTLVSIKPQIIHAHGLLSPTTTAIFARTFLGTPVVSKALRGGLLGDLERLLKKPFGRYRLRVFAKHVDMFITISKEIRDELLREGIPSNKCISIPNGVNLEKFKPLAKEEKGKMREYLGLPDGLLVIFAGRLEAEKRVDELIQVWPKVRDRVINAHLLILGTGREEDILKKMAGEGIHFLGLVENVAPYLQVADIFVLPSVSEGLSNALLEALASNLPVVVTATGGTTEVVQHKVSGWVIGEYSPERLIEGITTFLEDEDLRISCALEGKKYVMDNFSIVNVANRLSDLYKSLSSL